MADHFSNIGFRFDSRQEFGNIMADLFTAAKEIRRDPEAGRTLLWTDGAAQVWFHPESNWCIVPGFASTTKIAVKTNEWIEDDDGCPYCATLNVEVLGESGDVLYPLAITFGDVRAAREKLRLGKSCDILLAAFAESGKCWADTEAYRLSGDWPIGPRWFVPLGPFSVVDSMRDKNPRAIIYGVVREIQYLKNSWTGGEYRRVTVDSYGPTPFDAVIANHVLPEIQIGSVVALQSWLCAQCS